MFYRFSPHVLHVLDYVGVFHSLCFIFTASCVFHQLVPYVVVEASSCFPCWLHIVSSRTPLYFPIVNKYIVVDTALYTCALPIDHFLLSLSQTKLHWKAPNDGYLYICRIYKSNNRLLRYQTISNYKFHWLLSQEQLNRFPQSKLHWKVLIKQFLMIYYTLYED